jgi:hypothetical protein
LTLVAIRAARVSALAVVVRAIVAAPVAAPVVAHVRTVLVLEVVLKVAAQDVRRVKVAHKVVGSAVEMIAVVEVAQSMRCLTRQ